MKVETKIEADRQTMNHANEKVTAMEKAIYAMMDVYGAKVSAFILCASVTVETIDNRSNPRSGFVSDMKQTMWKVEGKRTKFADVARVCFDRYQSLK